MARRRYKRAASALTKLSKSKQDARFNELSAQGIRADTEGKVARMNKAFDLAGQALVTADALSQEYKTKGKIEKGVTSLAEAKGGEVSYKKTGIMDVFKGEAKLSDWGKESWNIGGTEYDRADVLAWHEKGQKDIKWEGIIGKEVTKYDKKSGEYTKGRSEPKTREPKEYNIQGEAELFGMEGMEKKYGKGWSYKKQKAIGKMSDVQRAGLASDKTSLLESQVAANVETTNYSTISKAYKSEYRGEKGYDADRMKALDLQNKSWQEKQTPARLKEDDKVKAQILSSKAAQGQSDVEDNPLVQPELTGQEWVDKNRESKKQGKPIDYKKGLKYAAGVGALGAAVANPAVVAAGAGVALTGVVGKALYGGIKKQFEKDFWGKRKGWDALEDWKDERAIKRESKAKDAIAKLAAGDDFVSASDQSLIDATEGKVDTNIADLGKDADEASSNLSKFDPASLTSTYDPESGEDPFLTDKSGKHYTEEDVRGGRDYTNPQIAIQAKKEAEMDYAGTAEQNIGVLEYMMGGAMGDITQEGSMYEGMGVSDIWNQGPLGEQYGKWGSATGKGKRKSMWASMQEIGYEGSYGNK